MDPYQINEPPKSNSTSQLVFKSLATVGFLVVLLGIIWAGIFLMRHAGSAFSALSGTTSTFLAFGGDKTSTTTVSGSTTGGGTTGSSIGSILNNGSDNTASVGGSTTGGTGGSTTGTTSSIPTPPPPPPTVTAGPTETTSYSFGGPTTTSLPYSDPNGLPDLEPKVLAIGYIDEYTGEFVATSSPKAEFDRKIAVKFEVANKGTKHTNDWMMNVVIPTNPHHIFHSNTLRNLYPGEKIEFVIAFTQANTGEVDIIINVDPFASDTYSWGHVKESNEHNNILKHTFTIVGGE